MSPSPISLTIKAPAVYTDTPLSFWGGISPTSGQVIDVTHPLHNASISRKVFCLPSGRGSCTGSQVMLELILNGVGPRVLILREVDVILCVGVIIAQEFFDGMETPVVCVVGEEQFRQLLSDGDDVLSVTINDDGRDVLIENETGNSFTARNLLALEQPSDTILSLPDSLISDDENPSQAKALAMKTIQRVASISNASELIRITSAHIDAVTYIGPGGLRFVKKLVELGGKVAVPTTLNSQSVDRRRWQSLGVDEVYATNANSVGDAYLKMGCDAGSFTCAPYLLPGKPKKGDDIMWGESNAVVYSNSVIGARTEKYADYFDILAAIVGAVPKVGVHVTENRAPSILIDAEYLIKDLFIPVFNDTKQLSDMRYGLDSFYPALGWLCGKLSDGRIPLILGFDALPRVTADNLKGFCAAFGTTGTAPLFHMANVTPEAMGEEVVKNLMMKISSDRRVVATKEDLKLAYETLDGGRDVSSDAVHLVALGNPHLSLTELKQMSEMIDFDKRPKNNNVDIIACLGRHVYTKGSQYIPKLETYGVKFINDTCWCMLLDPPIIPRNPNAAILTNSAKYASYGPGLTNRRLRFASFHECIEASKTGRVSRGGVPQWLRSFSTLVCRHLP